MLRSLGASAVLAGLLAAAPAPAATPLSLAAQATLADTVALHLSAHNTGNTELGELRPQVVYQGEERYGDVVRELARGARAAWDFVLPPPREPGSVPIVVQVDYRDAAGSRASTPLVHVVRTLGLPDAEVTATLTVTPVTNWGRATLDLENPGPAPIHGRVVAVLPAALTTEPTSGPVEIAPRARTEFPIVLQNAGARPDVAYPIFALLEYQAQGQRHAVVAAATASLAPGGGAPPVSPLLVGTAALLLAFAALALALRRAASTGRSTGGMRADG